MEHIVVKNFGFEVSRGFAGYIGLDSRTWYTFSLWVDIEIVSDEVDVSSILLAWTNNNWMSLQTTRLSAYLRARVYRISTPFVVLYYPWQRTSSDGKRFPFTVTYPAISAYTPTAATEFPACGRVSCFVNNASAQFYISYLRKSSTLREVAMDAGNPFAAPLAKNNVNTFLVKFPAPRPSENGAVQPPGNLQMVDAGIYSTATEDFVEYYLYVVVRRDNPAIDMDQVGIVTSGNNWANSTAPAGGFYQIDPDGRNWLKQYNFLRVARTRRPDGGFSIFYPPRQDGYRYAATQLVPLCERYSCFVDNFYLQFFIRYAIGGEIKFLNQNRQVRNNWLVKLRDA